MPLNRFEFQIRLIDLLLSICCEALLVAASHAFMIPYIEVLNHVRFPNKYIITLSIFKGISARNTMN